MPYILMLAEGTTDTLGTGSAQMILAVVCVALTTAVVSMALYIRKLMRDHKDEIKAISEETLAKVTALSGMLDQVQERRREEVEGWLTEVMESAQAMSESNKEMCKAIGDLKSVISDAIKKG